MLNCNMAVMIMYLCFVSSLQMKDISEIVVCVLIVPVVSKLGVISVCLSRPTWF